MSKKILPIITLLGTSALIVGATLQPAEEKKEAFIQNINSFKNEVAKYTSLNESNLTINALNKYTLSLQDNLDDLAEQNLTSINESPLETSEISPQAEENTNETTEVLDENNAENISKEEGNLITEENERISTLYSLSDDIEDSCDDFCELKEEITKAIVETQNLINKIQEKEIQLTNEQRIFITEQAQQLKNLGRNLSNITTELSFNLSDINQIMATNNGEIDNLSIKYLVVLDNLINGNEMLQSGLNSLNLINQMFNMQANNVPSNNTGRVLYGFRHNNNPPIIKDYYFDENGKMIENNEQNTQEELKNIETNENNEMVNNKTTNIDTYKNTNLNSNLDTYNNNNLPQNIDSFFNTALLDNEFMYGNKNYGYGYGGMNGMYNKNPYLQGYSNYEQNQTTNGITNNKNTQNDGFENAKNTNDNKTNRGKNGFKFKKNIDTFKDENEPDIKTKLANIKNSITGFFTKFKKNGLDDKIDNPVYKYNPSESEEKNS